MKDVANAKEDAFVSGSPKETILHGNWMVLNGKDTMMEHFFQDDEDTGCIPMVHHLIDEGKRARTWIPVFVDE